MRFISRSDLRGFGNQNVHFWDQYRPTINWFPHFSSSAIHIPVNIRISKNYYLICLNYFENASRACLSVSRYVSRLHYRDTSKHVILGTQQFKPTEFANQINLNMENAWGVLRCIVDTCMKLKEGKYLIMKDPNKVGSLSFVSYRSFSICINFKISLF